MASLVSVSENGSERLVISCQPSSRSWVICFGLIAGGIPVALYASDCCVWQLISVVFAFAAGVWYLDSWEEAIFDKSANTIHLTSQSVLQRFICASCYNRFELIRLEDVALVKLDDGMDESNVNVVLTDSSVISVCGTTAEISKMDCRMIVDRIQAFLKLDVKLAEAGDSLAWDFSQNVAKAPPSFTSSDGADSSPVADDASSSATSSDESFERVSAADLADYEATATEAKPLDVAESDATATDAERSEADLQPDQAYEQCITSEPLADENPTSSSPSDPLPCQTSEESSDVGTVTDDTGANTSDDPSH